MDKTRFSSRMPMPSCAALPLKKRSSGICLLRWIAVT